MILKSNAWNGGPLGGETAARKALVRWAYGPFPALVQTLAPTTQADPWDWRSPEVGWGLVLPDVPGLQPHQPDRAEEAPEALQALLAMRPGARVYRYLGGDPERELTHLRDYERSRDIEIGSDFGTGERKLPRFLLIFGSPTEIPWRFQFTLNAARCVGRLDLTGKALENYVNGLAGPAASSQSALAWSTRHGGSDITDLLANVVASPLVAALEADSEITPHFLDGAPGEVTVDDLVDGLHEREPGWIATTSHGITGPTDDLDQLAKVLGLPVDPTGAVLDVDALLQRWTPNGAIWFAHACCSAGGVGVSAYSGLFPGGSGLAKMMDGLAGLGSCIAPLPQALLGCENPLRAFVGQVEPTFNYTVLQPASSQKLTDGLVEGLYRRLYLQQPIGWALRKWMEQIGTYAVDHALNKDRFSKGEAEIDTLVYLQLAALDRASTVILGDPAALLSPLPSQIPAP